MKIASYLPNTILTNDVFKQFDWPEEKIYAKTGIKQRHVTQIDEYALDLAEKACQKLFTQPGVNKEDIDFLLYCTQSPDSLLPNNASLLQQRLGLNKVLGSFDYNQGCTGFIYGLSISKGLLQTNQANNVLLVTAETYSKYIREDDRSNRVIFGDGACATLLTKDDSNNMLDFVFGTDGSGADNLCVKGSGVRKNCEHEIPRLFMNGPELFSFTLREVPLAFEKILNRNNLNISDIDHFVFHQANAYMLEHLRDKLDIPKDKFHLNLENVGNTVSSTIPIVLEELLQNKKIKHNEKVLMLSFGIGYSWNATIYRV